MWRQVVAIFVGSIILLSLQLLWPTTTLAAVEECDYPLGGQWPETGSWTCDEGDGDAPSGLAPDQLTGNYCVAYGGISLHSVDQGTIELENFGTLQDSPDPDSVELAYILWSGRSRPDRRDAPTLNVGGLDSPINADLRTEAYSELGFYWHAYRADITEYYRNGRLGSSVTVGGLQIGSEAVDEDNHGVGIIVVYEDVVRCPYQDISIFYGNDVLYQGWDAPSGPNSEVACMDIPKVQQATRFDFQMFVGGIENQSRSDTIWFVSGSGQEPDEIAPPATKPAGAKSLIDQFQPFNGNEFDSYESSTDCRVQGSNEPCEPELLAASPNHEWLCFHIQSPKQADFPDRGLGISGAWLSLVVRSARAGISIEKPTAERMVSETHTWTVTVESTLGLTGTLSGGQPTTPPPTVVITPSVTPEPTTLVHSCETPVVEPGGATAECTVAITSDSTGVYTATAVAKITQVLDDETLTSFVATDGTTGNSGPAIVTYVPSDIAAITLGLDVNGDPADESPGLLVSVPPQGTNVLYAYTVQNTGDVALTGITVRNEDTGADACADDPTLPPDILEPGEPFTCFQQEAAELAEVRRHGSASATVVNEPDRGVEDQDRAIYTGVRDDWGDAPDSGPGDYATTDADNGPRHRINNGLRLGTLIDSEADGQPHPDALGDDLNFQQDEDSLLGGACLVQGRPGVLAVIAANELNVGPAQLHGWLDSNNNGRFDPEEQKSVEVPAGSGTRTYSLAFGTTPITAADAAFLRLRLSTDSAAAVPTGAASDGEVEDHFLVTVQPTLTVNASNLRPLPGSIVTLIGTATTSCGLTDQLQICFATGNGTACQPTGENGQVSVTHTNATSGVEEIPTWIDLNQNQIQDGEEPSDVITLTWLPDGELQLQLQPENAMQGVGSTHTVTATLTLSDGSPLPGYPIQFGAEGVHAVTETTMTDANGQAALTYDGMTVGMDTLTASAGVTASASIQWVGSYAITLEPATQRHLVGTSASVRIRAVGQANSPLDDLNFGFVISGVNGQAAGQITDQVKEDGAVFATLTYPYTSDNNHLDFDDVHVNVGDPLSAQFSSPGTASVEWVPIRMTVEPADDNVAAGQLEFETVNVTLEISDTRALALSGEYLVYNQQEDLSEQDESKQLTTEGKPMNLVAGMPVSQTFDINGAVRRLDNVIDQGCDIAFFGQSQWVLTIWTDLAQDILPTGEEPTCYVEEPTVDNVSGLTANVDDSSVRLMWQTSSEYNVLGFNVLRSIGGGPFQLANPTPITAEGAITGRSYEYVDTPPAAGVVRYLLDILLLDGATASSAPLILRYPEDFELQNRLFLPTVNHR